MSTSKKAPPPDDVDQKVNEIGAPSRGESTSINVDKTPITVSKTANEEMGGIDKSQSSSLSASSGPHARISSQVDAISYEETCPVDYPPGGIFYTFSKNVDEKSLPMDELEMKKHGLVDSHCEHSPFQGDHKDAKKEPCKSCSKTTPTSKMLPFDEFQLKQCGLIDPAGHHLNDIELKSIGRKGDPRHAQLANDIVDDTKLCDLSKSSKSITDNTKSLDSPYPRILKFDDTPILSTAEDEKAPILVEKSIEKAGRSTVAAGKSRYKLCVTGHVKIRSRRRRHL